jgi:hypothetical protein
MKWTLVFFILPILSASAATFSAQLNSGSAHGEGQLFFGEGVFTVNINDRSDLIAGLPIHVTFTPSQFSARLA